MSETHDTPGESSNQFGQWIAAGVKLFLGSQAITFLNESDRLALTQPALLPLNPSSVPHVALIYPSGVHRVSLALNRQVHVLSLPWPYCCLCHRDGIVMREVLV